MFQLIINKTKTSYPSRSEGLFNAGNVCETRELESSGGKKLYISLCHFCAIPKILDKV